MNIGRLVAMAALAASSTFTLSALAAPPHLPDMVTGGNKWQVIGYDDSGTTHLQGATQTLCFFPTGVVGTHQRYRWSSPTFGGWDGLATQEGDQVSLHGDFTFILNANAGHDSMEFELTASPKGSEAYGHWREWVENGNNGLTLIWNNVKLTRIGTCPQRSAAEVTETTRLGVNSLDSTAAPLPTPSGVDPVRIATEAGETLE